MTTNRTAQLPEPMPNSTIIISCRHPANRLYSWFAYDGTLCVVCCVCGETLRGAIAPESNTEAAQQHAAELEPCPADALLYQLHAAGCFDKSGRLSCYKYEVRDLLSQANLLALVGAGLLHRECYGPATYNHTEYYLTPAGLARATADQPTRSLMAEIDSSYPTSRQSHMFAARVDDLPLFSGTAPRGQAQTFDPPAADSHRQAKLF